MPHAIFIFPAAINFLLLVLLRMLTDAFTVLLVVFDVVVLHTSRNATVTAEFFFMRLQS